MSVEDLKQRILAWYHESDDIGIRETEAGDRDFALELDAHVQGQAPVTVIKERGQAWIMLETHVVADTDEYLGEFLETRPAPLDGRSAPNGVMLRTRIWLDGLTRQSFAVAVQELGRSHDALGHYIEMRRNSAATAGGRTPAADGSLADLSGVRGVPVSTGGFQGLGAQRPDGEEAGSDSAHVDEPAPHAEPQTSESPMAFVAMGQGEPVTAAPAPSPAAERAAPVHELSSFERAFQPHPQSVPQTTAPVQVPEEPAAKPAPRSWGTRAMSGGPNSREPEPTPVAADLPWTPTHLVPPTGMPAWAAPDPAQPPVARLDPQLQVQVTETAGGWAHILCSNGWAAWVDARLLVQG